MEINEKAKALLMGEIIEIKNAIPVRINSLQVVVDSHDIQYMNQQLTKPGRTICKFEGESLIPLSLDYNKKYYLIEVNE
jgi:hypothetical protein